MPANGGAGGRRQPPPAAYVGQQEQMRQIPTPNAMASVRQQQSQRGPAQSRMMMVHQQQQQQQQQQQRQAMAQAKTAAAAAAAAGGQGSSNKASAVVTPVSALTLLQRKRRRYESSSATADDSNTRGIGHHAANNGSSSNAANLGSSAPTTRLPPPLYLLLPPPAPHRSDINSSGSRHELLAASANLTSPGGTFEIGRGITEISGEAGSGKTQLCLRLCVSCALGTYMDMSSMEDGDGNHGIIGVGPQRQRQQQQQQMTMPPPPAAIRVKNPYANSSHHGVPPAVPPRPVPQQLQQHHHQQQQHHQLGCQRRRQYYRAVYVTMGEGLSPSQIAYRLGQMATASTSTTAASASASASSTAILGRILTRSVRNEDELLELVRRELPAMLRRGWDGHAASASSTSNRGPSSPPSGGRIGLVVLDSIAGMFRLPDAAKDKQGTAFFARRSEILFGLSAQLRKLGDEYGVAFVVANQVTAGKAASAGNGGGGPRIMGGGGGGGNAIPALGLSWSNCINTRFVLRRSETLSSRMGVSSAGSGGGSGSGSGATNANGTQQQNQQAQAPVSMFKRWARVAKSPVLPPVSVPFAIDVRGGVATENPK